MFPQHFSVTALAAKTNVALLAEQIEKFRPEIAVVYDDSCARKLKDRLGGGHRVEVLSGKDGYCTAASHATVDITVTAVVGAAGLEPTLAAIEAGKTIGLANKETLVMAGDIVIKKATECGIPILPIDSEHSAIFQCLEGQRRQDVAKVLLTASGGPFLNLALNKFGNITIDDALNHPNWKMGKKITIDSATLMNKGLEVIEAKHLFNVDREMIEVVIHPQSIIHSMVAYKDGSIIAQLGIPDMKTAIAYALSYPQRLPLNQPLPDFSGSQALTFQEPDLEKFPCLALAFKACEAGGTLPAVLNASSEVAVNAFLDNALSFVDIAKIISQIMAKHNVVADPNLPDILEADGWARKQAAELVDEIRE
jgi:1-deoxy-D-xylulose-5-phosphate reductoisomerase